MTTAPRLARLAGPVALGAVAALGLAPVGAWVATIVAIAAIGAMVSTQTGPWRAARLGWLFGTGYFALAMAWIVEPFLVDMATYGWMAPFALLFMATGLALFWAAAFGAAALAGPSPGRRIAVLAATWTLAEYARATVLTGFPWAAPAQVWVGSAPAQLLAWTGPHGLDVLTFGASLSLALLWLWPGRWRLAALFPALALGAASFFADRPAAVTSTGKTVRLIQPNAPQHLKWDPDHVWRFFRRSLDLTAAAGERVPDLVVWPESSVPPFLGSAADELALISRAAGGGQVVVGIRRAEGPRIFNSLAVLGPGGAVTSLYDKHHLVPFGEYMPLGGLFARWGIHGIAAEEGDGFSAGPGPGLVDLGPLGQAQPLICYEAIFPGAVNAAPARPGLLLQITNDAWFGTWSGPYQHLAQARMRAMEQGVPLVRAANTGVSAVIGPRGDVLAALPLGVAGHLDADLPAPLPPTLYSKTGDWPALAMVLLLCLGSVAHSYRSRRIGD